MKIKEVKTCGAFAWSPVQKHSGLMAIGSIAGAMSEDFNSDAYLEIRGVDIYDTNSTDMPVLGRIQIPDRVHRIDWSTHGGGRGILAGGFTDGTVSVWSADKVIEAGVPEDPDNTADEATALLCKISAHSSAAKGCHFNPLDQTLLATGGGDKELKIYSLDRVEEPKEVPAMGPNKTATMSGEVTDLRWNPKFKHILGTTTSNGQVSCCDLKSKKITMTFNISPQGSPSAANTLAWHPDVPTQVAVARDEPIPVIQVWDLRKATAPIREMKGHTKGVLSLAWCAEDAGMLMSTGADGRTMCWNPTTGDLFGEMPEQDNWVYDCKWAPHTPAVACTASFDNSLSIFGAQDISSANSNGAAPKWLSRPCSASFGFGGRISVLNKGDKTGKSIKIVKTPATDDSTVSKERAFCTQINSTPVNSAEGVDWINAKGWGEIGAAAAARVAQSKTPLMKFLGADGDAAEKKVAELTEAGEQNEDTIQDAVAECVTAGKLVAAIDLCMVAGKFDDAFALAYVTGDAQMKRVHAEFVARKSGKHRFAKYLGCIASGDFGSLVESAADLPWREVLSLYAAFAPSADYAAHCNKLGDSLYAAGQLEPAVTCYVFGSNVDKVAELQKESGKYDTQNLVQLLTILEQSVGRQCTAQAFAQALAAYAETLAFGGEFQSAAHYAQRAAQLGCKEAGLVAHRVQTHIGQRAEPAFMVTPLPDAQAMDVQMLAAKQPVISQQGTAAATTQPATATQPRPAGPSTVPNTNHGRAGVAPGATRTPGAGHVDPRVGTQPVHHTTAPTQPQHVATANTGAVHRASPTQPAGNMAHFGATGGAQPTGNAGNTGAAAAVNNNTMPPPSNTGNAGGPVPTNTGAPPPTRTAPGPTHTTTPAAVTPPPATGNAAGMPPAGQTNPPVPATTTAPPAVSTPTAPVAPVSMPTSGSNLNLRDSSMSSTAGGKESAADVDTSGVDAQYAGVVQVVQARVEKITEKRKRDTTEKAVVVLIKKLNNKEISPDLGALLVAWAAALQANPAAGAGKIPEWKVITEKHWDAIQPFFSIKFL